MEIVVKCGKIGGFSSSLARYVKSDHCKDKNNDKFICYFLVIFQIFKNKKIYYIP